MLTHLRDPTHAWNAYPAFWAPFVVVGEGGRNDHDLVWPRLVPDGVLRPLSNSAANTRLPQLVEPYLRQTQQ